MCPVLCALCGRASSAAGGAPSPGARRTAPAKARAEAAPERWADHRDCRPMNSTRGDSDKRHADMGGADARPAGPSASTRKTHCHPYPSCGLEECAEANMLITGPDFSKGHNATGYAVVLSPAHD